ncbi:hypothetical protein HD553DRAFT_325214 [Filobasidium floriforme]|uniref:uncharacterized protein n=1 Tax=Filobasidium floriforme TaxID=5210 RepID=UPI001E8E02DF|nr:uncharacterized protein HD553DRAFT_325214 [Filobasidium floriforme]KAH8082410.1 hypothetical protein HD553DRAFT_325214 [Filobasidium floriforme]
MSYQTPRQSVQYTPTPRASGSASSSRQTLDGLDSPFQYQQQTPRRPTAQTRTPSTAGSSSDHRDPPRLLAAGTPRNVTLLRQGDRTDNEVFGVPRAGVDVGGAGRTGAQVNKGYLGTNGRKTLPTSHNFTVPFKNQAQASSSRQQTPPRTSQMPDQHTPRPVNPPRQVPAGEQQRQLGNLLSSLQTGQQQLTAQVKQLQEDLVRLTQSNAAKESVIHKQAGMLNALETRLAETQARVTELEAVARQGGLGEGGENETAKDFDLLPLTSDVARESLPAYKDAVDLYNTAIAKKFKHLSASWKRKQISEWSKGDGRRDDLLQEITQLEEEQQTEGLEEKKALLSIMDAAAAKPERQNRNNMRAKLTVMQNYMTTKRALMSEYQGDEWKCLESLYVQIPPVTKSGANGKGKKTWHWPQRDGVYSEEFLEAYYAVYDNQEASTGKVTGTTINPPPPGWIPPVAQPYLPSSYEFLHLAPQRWMFTESWIEENPKLQMSVIPIGRPTDPEVVKASVWYRSHAWALGKSTGTKRNLSQSTIASTSTSRGRSISVMPGESDGDRGRSIEPKNPAKKRKIVTQPSLSQVAEDEEDRAHTDDDDIEVARSAGYPSNSGSRQPGMTVRAEASQATHSQAYRMDTQEDLPDIPRTSMTASAWQPARSPAHDYEDDTGLVLDNTFMDSLMRPYEQNQMENNQQNLAGKSQPANADVNMELSLNDYINFDLTQTIPGTIQTDTIMFQ